MNTRFLSSLLFCTLAVSTISNASQPTFTSWIRNPWNIAGISAVAASLSIYHYTNVYFTQASKKAKEYGEKIDTLNKCLASIDDAKKLPLDKSSVSSLGVNKTVEDNLLDLIPEYEFSRKKLKKNLAILSSNSVVRVKPFTGKAISIGIANILNITLLQKNLNHALDELTPKYRRCEYGRPLMNVGLAGLCGFLFIKGMQH